MIEKRTPSSSQTVGPFFSIGLEYLIDQMADMDSGGEPPIELQGKILDRDGAPVPDAMLEFWSSGTHTGPSAPPGPHGISDGFRRVATDADGHFAVKLKRPLASQLEDGTLQSPHAMVLVFARGLQRHLITRVYLDDEILNGSDPVLLGIPEERRGTVVAKLVEERVYRWNVRLQGTDETVFFRW